MHKERHPVEPLPYHQYRIHKMGGNHERKKCTVCPPFGNFLHFLFVIFCIFCSVPTVLLISALSPPVCPPFCYFVMHFLLQCAHPFVIFCTFSSSVPILLLFFMHFLLQSAHPFVIFLCTFSCLLRDLWAVHREYEVPGGPRLSKPNFRPARLDSPRLKSRHNTLQLYGLETYVN